MQQVIVNENKIKTNNWLFLLGFSVLSLITTLWLPHIGEEGVYTISSLEMYFHDSYWVPRLYGFLYHRPPLFNWLILGFVKLLGIHQVLFAARLVTLIASVALLAVLYGFVKQIFSCKEFALFSAVIFFSGDMLLRRGWLAYSDPLFAFNIFASIACVWIALETQKNRWLIYSVALICFGYLTKVHTNFIFYGIAVGVLFWQHPQRKILLSYQSIGLHTLAILFPFLWTSLLSQGRATTMSTITTTLAMMEFPSVWGYLEKIIRYPFAVMAHFLPVSFIAVLAWYQKKKRLGSAAWHPAVRICFWIVVLNLLPYWLAPRAHMRYIMPLYPFIAIVCSYFIWHAGIRLRDWTFKGLVAVLILKYVISLVWLPYEYKVLKGDAYTLAQEIYARVGLTPLYAQDATSAGLRVVAELNQLRWPHAPIINDFYSADGFILTDGLQPFQTELVEVYLLGKKRLYLWCRGFGCENENPNIMRR